MFRGLTGSLSIKQCLSCH